MYVIEMKVEWPWLKFKWTVLVPYTETLYSSRSREQCMKKRYSEFVNLFFAILRTSSKECLLERPHCFKFSPPEIYLMALHVLHAIGCWMALCKIQPFETHHYNYCNFYDVKIVV